MLLALDIGFSNYGCCVLDLTGRPLDTQFWADKHKVLLGSIALQSEVKRHLAAENNTAL